jgi:ribonucleotide reductase class II
MRKRVKPNHANSYYWRGSSAPVDTYSIEEVFCAEEPVTHSFVIRDGLLTGNCHGGVLLDQKVFGRLMDLAMCGTGTGVLLEREFVEKLPPVSRSLSIRKVVKNRSKKGGQEFTSSALLFDTEDGCVVKLAVGDSRQGWVDAYQLLIDWALGVDSEIVRGQSVEVELDLSQVRQKGERLKGFGGVANPATLETAYRRVTALLARAFGRKLTPIEACLLVDEAANAVVAGNIRRSAGIRIFSEDDAEARAAKHGLYKQDENGNWSVDVERESLRLANHTVAFHHRPTLEELTESVRSQFYSGEGAIEFAPEAIARSNADILDDDARRAFIEIYCSRGKEAGREYLKERSERLGIEWDERLLDHRMTRYSLNPCAEIEGSDFMCNLGEVHLNMIDPANTKAQHDAFYATGLMVGSLLQHKFPDEVLQYSREVDPIVAVCPTGIFDFFVKAFGTKWLAWMCAGRPNSRDGRTFTKAERRFLESWRESARQGVMDYCDQAGLKHPNRYTAVQPSGSKSLLTGASSGWHPPKAQRFIRRITFGVDDPLVSALRDYGYSVIPAQSARDDDGNLLDDISDPRVREVLVEIPTEVSWANLKGADAYDLSKIPVEAQMGLYMQVQRHYSTHTTSATIEFREDEIERLAGLVHKEIQEDGGYIGVAMLARFDANETFPRLPFEPIDKATYDRMMAVVKANRAGLPKDITVLELLKPYDNPDYSLSPQDTACANAACVAKAEKDEARGLS